jgi:hypothetical protein
MFSSTNYNKIASRVIIEDTLFFLNGNLRLFSLVFNETEWDL